VHQHDRRSSHFLKAISSCFNSLDNNGLFQIASTDSSGKEGMNGVRYEGRKSGSEEHSRVG